MAITLIPCKDCGTEISPRAASCPKCGSPVGNRPVDRSTQERKYAENLNMRAWLIGILILAVILATIFHAPH